MRSGSLHDDKGPQRFAALAAPHMCLVASHMCSALPYIAIYLLSAASSKLRARARVLAFSGLFAVIVL